MDQTIYERDLRKLRRDHIREQEQRQKTKLLYSCFYGNILITFLSSMAHRDPELEKKVGEVRMMNAKLYCRVYKIEGRQREWLRGLH
jgi:hypothetical protein